MNKNDKDLAKHPNCRRLERPNGPYYGRKDPGKYRGVGFCTSGKPPLGTESK